MMFKSLTSLAKIACAALITPTNSAWDNVLSLSGVVVILIFKSFEKTPATVRFGVLEPSVYISSLTPEPSLASADTSI